MFIYFLLGIIASLVYVYYKVVKPSKYWEERDVVHVKSWPIVGSMRDFVLKKKHITEVSIDVYKQYPKARWANVFVWKINSWVSKYVAKTILDISVSFQVFSSMEPKEREEKGVSK